MREQDRKLKLTMEVQSPFLLRGGRRILQELQQKITPSMTEGRVDIPQNDRTGMATLVKEATWGRRNAPFFFAKGKSAREPIPQGNGCGQVKFSNWHKTGKLFGGALERKPWSIWEERLPVQEKPAGPGLVVTLIHRSLGGVANP